MAHRKSFNGKSLREITNWPGKKEGENYAKTKMRLHESSALIAALHEATPEEWGITKDQIQECVFHDFLQSKDDRTFRYIGKRLGDKILWLMSKKYIDIKFSAEKLIQYSHDIEHFIAVKTLYKGSVDEEDLIKKAVFLLNSAIDDARRYPSYQYPYKCALLLKKEYPNLVNDDIVREMLGPFESFANDKIASTKRNLANSLQNGRREVSVAKVMSS